MENILVSYYRSYSNKFINADKHYCPFLGINTDVMYTCYKTEFCCDEGCCMKSLLSSIKTWYIWVAIILVIFAFTGGLKCCKVTAAHRRERILQRQIRRSRTSTPDSGVIPNMQNHLEMYLGHAHPPSLSNLEDRVSLSSLLTRTEACNAAIDRYIASARNRQMRDTQDRAYRSISPPPYHTVQYKPRPYDPSDPPPLYSTVCNNPPLQPATQVPETRSSTIYADVHGTLSTENASVRNEQQQIRVTFSGEVMANRYSIAGREQPPPADGAGKPAGNPGAANGGDVV